MPTRKLRGRSGKHRRKISRDLTTSKPASLRKGKAAKPAPSRIASRKPTKQLKAIAHRLNEPVVPLTNQDLAAGKSHTPADIELADYSMVTISLRGDRAAAFIVTCHCSLCDERRAAHFRV